MTVASESHSGTLEFDNLQGERNYNFFAAYSKSKLGNILFTYELARRLQGTSVTANCMSPGPTKTGFGNTLTGLPRFFPRLMKSIPFLFASPEKGAEGVVHLASEPTLATVTGRFFLRGRKTRTKPITYDTEVAGRLWTISDHLQGT